MLPKKERLTTVEFQTIITSGKVVRNDIAHLKFIPGEEKKFAVAVPKKIIKTAVMRHFAKRRIYNILQTKKDAFPNGSYIFFVTKELVGADKKVLESVILSLADKVASYR